MNANTGVDHKAVDAFKVEAAQWNDAHDAAIKRNILVMRPEFYSKIKSYLPNQSGEKTNK